MACPPLPVERRTLSELVFVRHGQASFGAESYDKLSELGVRQVRLLAEHWQRNDEQFDHIYSGELIRQKETASELLPLVKGGPAQASLHSGFNEYDGTPLIDIYLRDHAEKVGVGAGVNAPIHDRKLFQQVFEAATAKWLSNELLPLEHDAGFETWSEFQQRVRSAVGELMQTHDSGSRVLVSTSGGVIALALQHVLDLSDSQTIGINWVINNSSVTRIRYGAGRVSMSLFNGLAHLETPQHRELITYR